MYEIAPALGLLAGVICMMLAAAVVRVCVWESWCDRSIAPRAPTTLPKRLGSRYITGGASYLTEESAVSS